MYNAEVPTANICLSPSLQLSKSAVILSPEVLLDRLYLGGCSFHTTGLETVPALVIARQRY